MRLRVANCKSCGAPVRLTEDAPSLTCAACGTEMSRDEVIESGQQLGRHYRNLTPVKLGMKGLFNGQEYEVIGRVVLSMMEEGEKYTWTEFQLVSAEGHMMYLELDEGNWKLTEPFTPTTPVDPRTLSTGSHINLDGQAAIVGEIAIATVESVEGELTYAAYIGQARNYLDAKSFQKHYAIEWTDDELEFYRGWPLSERDVLVAFGLKKEIEALDARARSGRSQTIFAAACLVLSIVAFVMGGMASGSGRLISGNSVPVSSIGPEGRRFGPITLDPKTPVHRLIVYGQMSESSAWVSGVIEKGETELIGTQGDFWDESGHDSDGYWHESDLRKSSDFVARSAGPYYVRLYAESDTPSFAASQMAGYELRAGAVYPTYLFIFGGVAMVMSVLFFLLGSKEKLKKMAEEAD